MFLGIQMPKMAVFRPPNQTLGLTHCKCDSPTPSLFSKIFEKGVLQQAIFRFLLSQPLRHFFYFVFGKIGVWGKDTFFKKVSFPQEMSLATTSNSPQNLFIRAEVDEVWCIKYRNTSPEKTAREFGTSPWQIRKRLPCRPLFLLLQCAV